MTKRSKRTPKPSSESAILATLNSVVAELAASRKLTEKVIELAAQKDAQIKLVLESKFQNYVVMHPARPKAEEIPETFEHLADVSEVSANAAEDEMEASTAAQRKADAALEAALAEEFTKIAAEHAEAHEVQA